MTERKHVRIKEVEGGYLVDLDWQWKERREGEVPPEDREVIATSLTDAIAIARSFLEN